MEFALTMNSLTVPALVAVPALGIFTVTVPPMYVWFAALMAASTTMLLVSPDLPSRNPPKLWMAGANWDSAIPLMPEYEN